MGKKKKRIVSFEEKEAVLDMLYDLFKDGCPIPIYEDWIFDGADYLPTNYRDTLLASLEKYDVDVIHAAIGNDRNFVLEFIKILPEPTPIYRVHDINTTIEIWLLGNRKLAEDCVAEIVQSKFATEPTPYDDIERKLDRAKEKLINLKKRSSAPDEDTEIYELENRVQELTEQFEETIRDYEDFENNGYAIEEYTSYDEIIEKGFPHISSFEARKDEEKRWAEDGLVYNPHIKLNKI